MKTYFKTTETKSTDNYPYGYKKTTATFGLEFKPKKGFRTVFQTVNPKTGKLNKPKNSTYSPILLMYQNEEGHFKYEAADFYSVEGINKSCDFMHKNFHLFTSDQIKHAYAYLMQVLKAELITTIQYCGANLEDLKPLIGPFITIASQGCKEGSNVFDKIQLDKEKIDACHVKDYNPFKVTTYELGANGLQQVAN